MLIEQRLHQRLAKVFAADILYAKVANGINPQARNELNRKGRK